MGRINKTRINFKALDEWMQALGRKISIKVGIIGSEASQQAEGTELTNAELGAVHEFGATINHPGGTPYLIKEDGTAQFVSKEKGGALPKTKPHQIIIPTRSFLRMPLMSAESKKELRRVIADSIGGEIKATDLSNKTANKILDDTVHLLAETAYLRVLNAFYTEGYGNWKPTTPASKQMRKYNPEAPTLIDKGNDDGLLGSISYEIKETK